MTDVSAQPSSLSPQSSSAGDRASPPRRVRPLTLLGLGILSAGLVLFASTGRSPAGSTASPETAEASADADSVTLESDAPQWKYVELAIATAQPMLPPLPAPGRVGFDPKRTASVGAPLPGRIESLLVRSGDRVRAGDKLFSVRSGAFAEIDRDVGAARAAVTVKQSLRERAQALFAMKAIPEKEALAAEAELHEAELALKTAVARAESLGVETAGTNLYWVRAPRAGTVVDVDVSESQEVTPDRDRPLLRISELDEVLVLADVLDADVPEVHVGAKVVIRAGSSVERTGTVERVSEIVDPGRRTVEVRIRADNKDRALKPNAFVEVVLEPDANVRRVRVPTSAVVSDGNTSVVFVAHDRDRLARTPVTAGRARDGQVEILSGLDAGTRFVARGAILLLNQIELRD